ncbi:hypothetical protein DPMN_152545 [Dreissena polymorpha]|uniref:Uncharacterized protein n=1 Tax=Dreissena polymorpha TaxID=45954 RepID=A0A9D4FLG3_DREPO|nr:hypothetical protein DPMN_152545 [Dreissena polymorpha]
MVLVNQGFEQRNTSTYDYEAMKNNAKKLRFGNFSGNNDIRPHIFCNFRDNTDDEENIPLAELQKHLRNKQFADIQSSSSESDTMYSDNSNSQNSPVRRVENDSSDDQMQIDAVALRNKKRKLTKKTSRSNNAMKKAIFTCLQTMAEHM